MLRSFHIQNFKSLTDFRMDGLGQFSCLIGLNGAGKTTVLQALDFMAHLTDGGVDEWLKKRDWSRNDLTSKSLKTKLISFCLDFDFGENVTWEGAYNTSLGRCTREEIWSNGIKKVSLTEGHLAFSGNGGEIHRFDSSRFLVRDSILSFIRGGVDLFDPIEHIQEFMGSIKSLELLAPHRMRMKSRSSEDIGMGGEKLSGFLHGLSKSRKSAVIKDIQGFYPHIEGYETKSKRAGWAELSASERFGDENSTPLTLETNAQHLNDGLLRILTIVAQTKTDHQFLLFDEIENGINPEKIGQLVV